MSVDLLHKQRAQAISGKDLARRVQWTISGYVEEAEVESLSFLLPEATHLFQGVTGQILMVLPLSMKLGIFHRNDRSSATARPSEQPQSWTAPQHLRRMLSAVCESVGAGCCTGRVLVESNGRLHHHCVRVPPCSQHPAQMIDSHPGLYPRSN